MKENMQDKIMKDASELKSDIDCNNRTECFTIDQGHRETDRRSQGKVDRRRDNS